MRNLSAMSISAILGVVFFSIGYFIVIVVPGGGTVTEEEFMSFYGSDAQFFSTLMLLMALLAGCWAMVWFVTELRTRLPESVLANVAYVTALFGLLAVAVGGAILFAPLGVQINSGGDFVGVPIAHTFSQAGLTAMLFIGMYSIGFAVALFSIALRRTGQVSSWLSIAGIVIAVLMIGSFVWAPGFLFPIWVLAVGVFGMRQRSSVSAPIVAPA